MIEKVSGVLVIPAEVVARVKEMRDAGSGLEAIVQMIRDSGLFQGQTYKLLRQHCGLSYQDAKQAIHESQTWADVCEATEELHETAYQAALQAGFTESEITTEELTRA